MANGRTLVRFKVTSFESWGQLLDTFSAVACVASVSVGLSLFWRFTSRVLLNLGYTLKMFDTLFETRPNFVCPCWAGYSNKVRTGLTKPIWVHKFILANPNG